MLSEYEETMSKEREALVMMMGYASDRSVKMTFGQITTSKAKTVIAHGGGITKLDLLYIEYLGTYIDLYYLGRHRPTESFCATDRSSLVCTLHDTNITSLHSSS
jgi:hypothetical protein